MKYLVISDNHGQRDVLERIYDKFQTEVDLFLHCGDSEFAIDNAIWQNFKTVRGNCDYEHRFAEYQVLKEADDCILLTHGHLVGVNFGLERLSLLAKQNQANLVFFGHTHCLGVEMVDGCLYLNPGSISYPRGEFQYLGGTFAIVETTPTIIKVQYYDQAGQVLPDLTREFTRK